MKEKVFARIPILLDQNVMNWSIYIKVWKIIKVPNMRYDNLYFTNLINNNLI
jgi:hypothetical protein